MENHRKNLKITFGNKHGNIDANEIIQNFLNKVEKENLGLHLMENHCKNEILKEIRGH